MDPGCSKEFVNVAEYIELMVTYYEQKRSA
jgi:hypothetical protein